MAKAICDAAGAQVFQNRCIQWVAENGEVCVGSANIMEVEDMLCYFVINAVGMRL